MQNLQHILIVEDEKTIANRIARLTRQVLSSQIQHIKLCASFADGLAYLRAQQIDLLLLDLQLNGENGFDLLEEVTSYSFHTIIISANTDQALIAFEYGVLDFIAKPFTVDRLRKAFSRLEDRRDDNSPQMARLQVKKRGQVLVVPIDQVSYIKAAGNYSQLHLKDGSQHLHEKSLVGLLSLLPDYFVRIHRSTLCDSRQIMKLLRHGAGKYEAVLYNENILAVGRQYYQAVVQKIGAV